MLIGPARRDLKIRRCPPRVYGVHISIPKPLQAFSPRAILPCITADPKRQAAGPALRDPPRFLSRNSALDTLNLKLFRVRRGGSLISKEQRAQTSQS